MDEAPKLRNGIDIFPLEVSGRKALLLRDRLNISKDLTLSMDDAAFLPFLTGKYSIRDIQAELMRQHGFSLISTDRIKNVIDLLDENHYLENENFYRMKQSVSEAFRSESIRRAAHAGKSYEPRPSDLRNQIRGFFLHPDGPGALPEGRKGGRLKALIAPHIDFQRGGPCYAWAYKELAEHCRATCFVILGTAHLSTEKPFVLTEKAFETPFGMIDTNRRFVKRLCDAVGEDLFTDELLHRSEHVIEFQLLFLQYLYPSKEIEIVPVLCGSFHEMISTRASPQDMPLVSSFLTALSETIRCWDSEICLIASADLAHIGPQFGGRTPVSRAELPSIERSDMEMLEPVRRLDAEGFHRLIMEEGDKRNICGLPPIYTLLKVVDAETATVVRYGQAYHPQATVTFASVAFYG